MGIVVLALRCYLVFQNVFITFKTLKMPPPSSRNNGQPSVRAMTQRKRDMKGCMAIWIVWCCLALYESLVERVVWIVIPFYDEIKSVILIFLILTRARSAEPIYLHVIRPLVKPYVSTLDAILGVVHNIGDFILLLLSIPFSAALHWWYGPSADEDQTGLTEADSESVRSGDEPPVMLRNRSDYSGQHISRGSSGSGEAFRPGAATEGDHDTYPRGISQRDYTDTLRSRFYGPGPSSQSHQIWRPPPSSYEDADDDAASSPNVPTAMPEPHIPSIGAEATEDWRTYPPFPSAYPPTPAHPTHVEMPMPVHPSQFAVVPEEANPELIINRDQTSGTRQGFGQSLLLPREPPNPGSDGGLSDETKYFGVQTHDIRYVTSDDSDEDMDDYETEEDSFDVTLRTPQHRRILQAVDMGREVSTASIATEATVASSVPSETTALTTDHCGSSLRTATHTMSRTTSSNSSVAGVKRPLPRYKPDIRPRPRVADIRSPKKTKQITRNTGRSTAIARTTYLKPTVDGTASDDTFDDDVGGAAAAQGQDATLARKRRRVATTPRTRRVLSSRPAARGSRDVSQSSDSRLDPDSKKATIRGTVRPPVATKTSLRSINGRPTARGAPSSGSGSLSRPRPTVRKTASTSRP